MLHKLILVGATAGLLATGAMHTHLTKAEPGIDSTVTAQPKELRLWFNEAPEVALSSATIVTADNKPVGTAPVISKLTRKDNHTITITLAGYLPYETTVTRSVSG